MADTKTSASLGKQVYLLLAAAGVLLVVALVGIFIGGSGGAVGSGAPSSLGADVEAAVRIAQDPSRGLVPDFPTLAQRIKSVDAALASVGGGSPLAASWRAMHDSLDTIVGSEEPVRGAAASAATISAAIPGLSSTYEQLATKLSAKAAAPGQLLLAADQLVRLQRIRGIAIDVLASGTDAQATATRLDNETKTFARNIALLSEPAGAAEIQAAGAEELAKKAKADFAPVQSAVAAIVEASPAVNKAQQASATVASGSAVAVEAARRLDQSIRSGAAPAASGVPIWVYVLIVLALVLLGAFAVISLGAVRRREKLAEDKEARQQQAILNLLDEITNLANGDLTVDVTVTEDFTGAIADSINYTVQTLRGLVGTINQTSEQIVASAANTQDTATRMSQASDRQAREIASVTNSVSATSNQLQEVAGRAERLAVQAQTSVQIAHNGAGTVGRTIQSMAALREQIQDTAKRIKRLGESSQEIGNITELINDIAEQTNTLALNASIQAAMAGEQGRGFAVVADEVQRLAERAGSATRQIENLVKTIQADTNEAIISMERSTANVVSGAKSAEEAGQSLTRIEASSQELAQLISEISLSARGQSAEATKIAGTMQGIREIAVQTSGSAERTSKAVGELNSLSDKLRESVAGFKLPEARTTA